MNKILIATDFSEAATNAVNFGVEVAKFQRASILVLNTLKN